MRNNRDLIGETFGKLEVIKFSHFKKTKTSSIKIWECSCKCGNIRSVSTGELNAKRVISCHACYLNNLIGQKFNRLLVVSKSNLTKKAEHAKWNCICDCGNTHVVNGYKLKSGNTKSCGCYNLEVIRLPPGESGFNRLFKTYKLNAKYDDRVFEITKEQIKVLTKQNCDYCGTPPSQISTNDSGDMSLEGVENSKYIYNGLDRKDNSQGYSLSNIKTSCFYCNRAKMDMTWEEWETWAVRFIKHASKTWLKDKLAESENDDT